MRCADLAGTPAGPPRVSLFNSPRDLSSGGPPPSPPAFS